MDNFVITNSNKKQKLHQTQSNHLVEPEIANENSISTNNCYIFDGQFFSIIKEENKNILAQCQKCTKVIQGQKGSTGNFLSHIKVCFINV